MAVPLLALTAGGVAAAIAPEARCEARKNEIAGTYAACRQHAEGKAIEKWTGPDFSKCDEKLFEKWAQAEEQALDSGAACMDDLTVEDVQLFVAEHADAVAAALRGGGLPDCGDGSVNAIGEQCDGGDLGGEGCESLGFRGGALACDSLCSFDTSGCEAGGSFPASGQTLSYGEGSDGHAQSGSPLSYTDNGDGTITDDNTGLMWEKKDDSQGIHGRRRQFMWCEPGSYYGDGCVNGPYEMDGTLKTVFLDTLNDVAGGGANCFAGHCDWRIPNYKELMSIVDYGRWDPAVHPAFHHPTGCDLCNDVTEPSCSCTSTSYNGPYFTSTTSPEHPQYALSIGTIDGALIQAHKFVFYFFARAVRGGRVASTDSGPAPAVPSLASAAESADQCEAAKNEIAGDYAECRQLAEAKAIKEWTEPDFSKCDEKLFEEWAKAEGKAMARGQSCIDGVAAEGAQLFVTKHTDAVAAALSGSSLPRCGDGFLNAIGEQCDGADLSGEDCASLGFSGGTLVCNPSCRFDASACQAGGSLTVTGQTVSYGEGTDGDVQAGAPLSYTDNGDGTITDNNTGLMWEKKDDSPGIHGQDRRFAWCIGSGPECDNGTGEMDGTAKTVFLDTLNDVAGGGANCFAGYCDWRIANARELLSIIDLGRSLPAVDPAFHHPTGCNGCTDVAEPSCSCTLNYGTYCSSTAHSAPAWLGREFQWCIYSSGGSFSITGKSPYGGEGFNWRAVRGGP